MPDSCALQTGLQRNLHRDSWSISGIRVSCDVHGRRNKKIMSNIITGAIAVVLASVYLLYYAIRLESIALWIIILANLGALLYDYFMSIKVGEDHI